MKKLCCLILLYLFPNHQSKIMYRRIPISLFLLLTAGLLFAPAVMAATGSTLTRGQSYAIALLGLAAAALSIYLFTVMFQPEKF